MLGGAMPKNAVTDILGRIRHSVSARAVLIVDDGGDLVAGDAEGYAPSATLRQLWVDRLGAAKGLSRLVDSPDFAILAQDLSHEHVLCSPLKEDRVLFVVFDQARTSLALVRLRLREHRDELMLALQSNEDDDE
jgi:hypothetical protein